MSSEHGVEAIRWCDGELSLLDQRLLAQREDYLPIPDCETAARAIADLVVRGAPAIGITAAYAVVLAARRHGPATPAFGADLERLAAARPTAVNLRWAVERLADLARDGADADDLEAEARRLHADDIAANRAMGRLGAAELGQDVSVLTHCNTGALATGGFGTALGVIRTAWAEGRLNEVFAGETRPWLQGSRLTAWELAREGIPVSLVLEGAVAALFARRAVDWLVVGADRIVANGDVANKIGTYAAAIHARHHGARVMVVAPRSTIDRDSASGAAIPIEERHPEEVTHYAGRQVAATGAGAWNPVFDVTPNALIDVIVTEAGVARPPFDVALAALFESPAE